MACCNLRNLQAESNLSKRHTIRRYAAAIRSIDQLTRLASLYRFVSRPIPTPWTAYDREEQFQLKQQIFYQAQACCNNK